MFGLITGHFTLKKLGVFVYRTGNNLGHFNSRHQIFGPIFQPAGFGCKTNPPLPKFPGAGNKADVKISGEIDVGSIAFELPSVALNRLVWLLIVLLLLFSMKFCYCDTSFHGFMQMLPFLLNGQRREAAEPGCSRLEDRLQKAAKSLREELALPVPRKLRHQGQRNWGNWRNCRKLRPCRL